MQGHEGMSEENEPSFKEQLSYGSKIFVKSVVVALLVLFFFDWVFNRAPEYETQYITHRVSEGETWWGIGTKYFKKQDKYTVLGEFVYDIRDANGGVEKQFVYVGEEIKVPLKKEIK